MPRWFSPASYTVRIGSLLGLSALGSLSVRCGSSSAPATSSDVATFDENDLHCDPFEKLVDDIDKPAVPTAEPLTQWVNPSIGTGGFGFGTGSTYPGAQVPFGMAKPSPDTLYQGNAADVSHSAGYSYADDTIGGFSHSRLNGAGISDYGNMSLMPTIGMAAEKAQSRGYASPFRHETEKAAPGYYAVHLDDTNIDVELTATARVAMHRYRFPASTEATVLLDAGHILSNSVVVSASKVTVEETTRRVAGYAHVQGGYSGRSGGAKLYFVAHLSRAYTGFGTWKNGVVESRAKTQEDKAVGAYFTFDTTTDNTVEVHVGLSYVDEAHAAQNLDAEDQTFDAARAAAQAEWEARLGRVRIEARSDRDRTMFYTALYHTQMMPTLASDTDGSYRGIDGNVHTANGFKYYTDFSLWDTYRNLHSLVTLVYPEDATNFAASLVQMGKDSGALPRWPLATGETRGMIGDSAAIVLAETQLKGITGWDARAGYDIAKKQATQAAADGKFGRDYVNDWNTLGYIASESTTSSVSMTLEYAAADDALSAYATSLGETADAAMFKLRSKAWEKLYDPQTHFFFPKNKAGVMQPVNPTTMAGAYDEGDAWHYNFMLPYDTEALIAKMTKPVFEGKLEQFFLRALCIKTIPYLPNPYFWPANEPALFSPWAFAVAGDAERAGRFLRHTTLTAFGEGPDGLPGNDDGGTMSAFYVFSTLGFYPVAGTDRYVLGSPLFPKATLTSPQGQVSIDAPNASRLHMVPSQITQGIGADGVPRKLQAQISHRELLRARLNFTMDLAKPTAQ